LNAQRWIAVAMLIVIVIIAGTSGIWLPFFEDRDSDDPTPTPEEAEVTATVEPTQGFSLVMRTTQTLVPTLDPVIISLMQETGLQALGVGQNPVIILGGEFTIVDDLHRATGTASVYRMGDNNRVLRLDPFEAINGPDLHVLLSQNVEPRTSADVLLPSYVDLGKLKAAEGAQNYDIPIAINLDLYKSVVIYSTSLSLVFSTAPLEQVRG
jgi:hypothetical protein